MLEYKKLESTVSELYYFLKDIFLLTHSSRKGNIMSLKLLLFSYKSI